MYLSVQNLKKSYGNGSSQVQVLKGINTEIEKGQMCVILGPSGSGKSTFLNLIGGLDTIDSGNVIIDGLNIAGMDSNKLSKYRRDYLGFIFQFYNLVPNLTIYENIQVCENLTQKALDINELLDILGLTEHKNKFPSQLSGGQQQRCAIARALVKNPKLLLCDEPTGALDSETGVLVLKLLLKMAKIYGKTIIIVTHNQNIAKMADQVIRVKNGKIKSIENNEHPLDADEVEW